MKIYISGPITGRENRNLKAFKKAEKEINSVFKSVKIEQKIKVINPVKLGLKLDKQYKAAGKEPPEWEKYMRICIKELCQCDYILLLPDWGLSQGAVVEKYLAERLKIPCAGSINELENLIRRD